MTDGDSVVCVESATPRTHRGIQSVKIEAGDIRWYGFSDRLMAEGNLHAFLPVIDEVQTIIGRFLEGERSGNALLPANLKRESYSEA
jgi:hypothetical protein